MMMPSIPFNATEPLQVVLEARQWDTIMGLLGDVPAPYRVTSPLLQALSEQLLRQQRRAQPEDRNVVPMGAD